MKILSVYIVMLLAILPWYETLSSIRGEMYSLQVPVEKDHNMPDHEHEDPEPEATDWYLRKEEKITWKLLSCRMSEPFTLERMQKNNAWVQSIFAPPEI